MDRTSIPGGSEDSKTGVNELRRLRKSASGRRWKRRMGGSELTVVSDCVSLVSSIVCGCGGGARTRMMTSHLMGSKIRVNRVSRRIRSKSSVTTASVSSVRSADSVVMISRHLSRSSSVRILIRIPANNQSNQFAFRQQQLSSTCITEAVSDSSGGGLRTRMRTSQLVVRRRLVSIRISRWKTLRCGGSDPASDWELRSQSVTSLSGRGVWGGGGYWRMLTSHSGGGGAGCCEPVWDAPSQSVYSLGSRAG